MKRSSVTFVVKLWLEGRERQFRAEVINVHDEHVRYFADYAEMMAFLKESLEQAHETQIGVNFELANHDPEDETVTNNCEQACE